MKATCLSTCTLSRNIKPPREVNSIKRENISRDRRITAEFDGVIPSLGCF